MSTQTNLKGRWVKALINGPASISSWRQGEYRKITNDNGNKIEGGFAITITADYCELMPEGFNPDNKHSLNSFEGIVGRWYKTVGSNFIVNQYLKYVGIEGINSVIYSERITFDGIHNVFELNQHTSISKPHQTLELVPDEEVAPYINKIVNNFLIY